MYIVVVWTMMKGWNNMSETNTTVGINYRRNLGKGLNIDVVFKIHTEVWS